MGMLISAKQRSLKHIMLIGTSQPEKHFYSFLSNRTWIIINLSIDLLIYQLALGMYFNMEDMAPSLPSIARSSIYIYFFIHLLNIYRIYQFFSGYYAGIGSQALYRIRMFFIFIFTIVLTVLNITVVKIKLTGSKTFFMLMLVNFGFILYIILTWIYREIVLKEVEEVEAVETVKENQRFEELRKGLSRPNMTTEQLI